MVEKEIAQNLSQLQAELFYNTILFIDYLELLIFIENVSVYVI